jgi:hypothetical protein
MDQALAPVGSILQAAADEGATKPETMSEVFPTRWKPSELAQLRQICARHGTTPGAFLRAAGRAIIAQYGEANGERDSTATA